MADDKVKTSRSGFLSKLKGSKGAKEDTSKDVDDFLKPSTEKAALMRPRIDIAIAQRWPEAQTVEDHAGPPSFETPQNPNGMRKKRRKEGLVVGFVTTAPEIMGEGGDESPYPTIEISRMKERQRPATDMHRRSIDGMNRPQQSMNDPAIDPRFDEREPKPLRRANTSHHESPPPSLQPMSNAVGPAGSMTSRGLDPSTVRTTGTPLSQHDRKRSLMNLSEGMALRRASSIPDFDGLADDDDDDNDNDDPDDPPPHFGPSKELKNFSMPRMAPVPPQTAARTPEHNTSRVTQVRDADADSPSGSPFDDPKYVGGRAQAARAPRGPPQRTPDTTNRAVPPQRYPGQANYAVPSRQQPTVQTSARPVDTRPDGNSNQYVPYTNPEHTYSQTSLQNTQRSHSNTQPSTPNLDRQTATSGLDPNSASSDRELRSTQPSPVDPTGGEVALADFAARVAHMKGVFQLTAQKERPNDKCIPDAWLRTAFWWYLKGKLGLEFEVRQRAQSGDGRELLLQGHVDLAKAWWILLHPLQSYGQAATSSAIIQRGYAELQGNMQGLCMSLRRNNILPPSASLIQGQDTRIWLSETSNLNSTHLAQYGKAIALLDALPLGDSDGQFCYSRYPVSIALSNRQGSVDQTTTSGLLTVVRPRNSYYTGITIANQDDWLTLKVNATNENNSISWRDVSWNPSMNALTITLPDGIAVNARLQQGDYKSVGNMVEYTRNAVRTRQPAQHETLLYQAQLAALAYSTSQGPSAFPRDAVNHCQVLVFRGRAQHGDAHRVVFVTEPSVKIVSCASHTTADLGSCVDSGGSESPNSLTTRFTEARKQSRAILTFHNQQDMLAFQALGHGSHILPQQASELPLARSDNTRHPEPAAAPTVRQPLQRSGDQLCAVSLLSHEIRSAAEVLQAHDMALPSTLPLQWRGMTVQRIEPAHDDDTDETDHIGGLQVILVHGNGSFQDQLSLQKGELALKLETDIGVPKIEILREPQPSFDASVDVQSCPPPVASAISRAVQLARQQTTIRTFMFPTLEALHQFQAAITGFDVRYDGLASNFAISRRMMVVPIHHKWTASNVRLQIVSNAQGSVVRILAFMDGFDHAEAMCFQVKSTDVFEKSKGDSKGKKWSVKLVDAKFSLPGKAGKKEDEIAYKSRRRYVNLEGLDYAEEHDDVTIGFDTEDNRDLFTRALPAATTVGRMITLRRRI